MTPVIHIVGLGVTVGTRVRQRCAWCGAVIDDRDLSREMVPAGSGPWHPVGWEPGGAYRWVVDQPDDQELPDGSCALIDDSVTT